MAEEVGKGIVPIEADTKGLGADIAKKVDGESGTIGKVFSKVGSAVGKAFKVAAVAAGAGAIAAIAFGKASIDAASDLNESMSKVDVVFGDASQSVIDWSKTSAKAMGQSQQQALEAAGTYGNLFQAFGLAQKPATEMSTSLVQLASDLASFNNTSPDEALEALRSGLSGETEPLKRYGVAINDARLKDEALRMGLIKSTKEALTPAAKAQAAYALIMKDTVLAQGDFARTSDGLANKQRILGAKFQDVKASIGKALLPALLAVVSVIADKVLPKVQMMWQAFVAAFSGEGITSNGLVGVAERIGVALRAVVDWVTDAWPTIKTILVGVFDAFRTAASWVIDHQPVLIGVIVGITAALVAYAVVTAAAAASTVAAAAPFIAIGVAIAALAGGVIYAYQNWGWFRTAVDAVASFMKDTLWPILQDVFGWLRDNVPPIIQKVIDVVSAMYGWFNDNVIPVIRAVASWFRDDLVPALQLAYGWFNDHIVPVLQAVAGVIRDVVLGAIDNLRGAFDTLSGQLKTAWDRTESLRFLLAGAFGLAVDAIKLQVDLLWGAVKLVADWLQTAWDKSDGLRGLVAGAFKTAIDGIKGAFDLWLKPLELAVSWLGKVIDKVQWLIDHIPRIPHLPDLTPFGDVLDKYKPKQDDIGARASGGHLDARSPSWVGEGGGYRELFVPDVSGYVLNHQDAMAVAAGAAGGRTGVAINGPVTFESALDVDAVMRVANFQLAAMGVD